MQDMWNNRGTTLIELMMALAITGILVVGISITAGYLGQTFNAQDDVVDMEGMARTVTGMLTRDLRMAGYQPVQGSTITGITYDPATLYIQADLNGDGVLTNPGEFITYSYNPTTLQLVRTANTVGQTVFANTQAFTLTYYDSTGAPTTTSANIRQVGISLTLRAAHPDPSWPTNAGYRTVQLQVLVTPRNLGL